MLRRPVLLVLLEFLLRTHKMKISRFYVDKNPIAPNVLGAELTFTIWREYPFGSASVNYAVTEGTATIDTDYDDSLSAYSNIVIFEDEEIFKEIKIAILGNGFGTVNISLSNPQNGIIIEGSTYGTIMEAGSVRFYAAQATGTGDGSSATNAMAYTTERNVEVFFESGNGEPGRCVLFKRGDEYDLSDTIRIRPDHSGTFEKPSIIGAYGIGENPVFIMTGNNGQFGTNTNQTLITDTRHIIRDITIKAGQNTLTPFQAAILHVATNGEHPFYNVIIERVKFTNPDNWLLGEGIQRSDYSLYGSIVRFCHFDKCGNGGYILFDNKSNDFTAPDLLTGQTSNATVNLLRVVDNGDGTGALIVDTETASGVFQDNEEIRGAISGIADTNLTSVSTAGNNPHRIDLKGGSGLLGADQQKQTYYGNYFYKCGNKYGNLTWGAYCEGEDLKFYGNFNVGYQGYKFRSCNGGSITRNYSRAIGGAQNYNFNYFKNNNDFNDVVINGNIAEGCSGYSFQEADGTDASDMTWGIKNVIFSNNVANINQPNLYLSGLLGACLVLSSLNIRNVKLINNTLVQDASQSTNAPVISFSTGTVKEDKFTITNNLIKRITSGAPPHGIYRANADSGLNFTCRYNYYVFSEGVFSTHGGTNYTTLANHITAYPGEESNSTATTSIVLNELIANINASLLFLPEKNSPIDGIGANNLVLYDIIDTLRSQPPTIGSWELSPNSTKASFFNF